MSSAPVEISVSAEVSGLGDVVSESIRAEAVTRSSIAVMPFRNMSGDQENDYFSYGLTEDIIRLLARNRWLAVILVTPASSSVAPERKPEIRVGGGFGISEIGAAPVS